jgi:hypothetical protein
VLAPALGVWVGRTQLRAPHLTLLPPKVCVCNVLPSPPARCPGLFYVCRPRGKGVTGVLPPNMCSLQPWVCGWVGLSCGRPTPPRSHPRYARIMCPRPNLHAVRDSPMYLDHGTRAGQGCCLPTCAPFSPGCVGGGNSAAGSPPHPAAGQCARRTPGRATITLTLLHSPSLGPLRMLGQGPVGFSPHLLLHQLYPPVALLRLSVRGWYLRLPRAPAPRPRVPRLRVLGSSTPTPPGSALPARPSLPGRLLLPLRFRLRWQLEYPLRRPRVRPARPPLLDPPPPRPTHPHIFFTMASTEKVAPAHRGGRCVGLCVSAWVVAMLQAHLRLSCNDGPPAALLTPCPSPPWR